MEAISMSTAEVGRKTPLEAAMQKDTPLLLFNAMSHDLRAIHILPEARETQNNIQEWTKRVRD